MLAIRGLSVQYIVIYIWSNHSLLAKTPGSGTFSIFCHDFQRMRSYQRIIFQFIKIMHLLNILQLQGNNNNALISRLTSKKKKTKKQETTTML